MNRVEPNRNVYIGHRYVPLLVGEWDKTIQYEGLSIVTFKGASYTSKKMTPAGIDIENEEYWTVTGNYNAQVDYYRDETQRVSNKLDNKVDKQEETQMFNIPADFSGLNEAFEVLSVKRTKKNVMYILNIQSGYKIKESLSFLNGDYGNFVITSEDDIVYLDDEFVFMSNNDLGTNPDIESFLIYGSNSRLPILECLIDVENKVSAGYYATKSSTGLIKEHCGIKNADFVGIESRTSIVSAQFGIADNCGYGFRAQHGGIILAQGASADNCHLNAVFASRGSMINFVSGKGRNSGEAGVRSFRSRVLAMYSDLSGGSAYGIIASENGLVSADNVNVSNSASRAIQAIGGSTIDATNVTGSNSASGIRALRGSTVIASFGDFDNLDGDVINSEIGSTVVFNDATAINSKGRALHADQSSKIIANGTDISGVENGGVRCFNGSSVNFNDGICNDSVIGAVSASYNSDVSIKGAQLYNSGGNAAVQSQNSSRVEATECDTTGSSAGFNIFNGSFITKYNAVGDAVQDVNTLTSRGIIFDGQL